MLKQLVKGQEITLTLKGMHAGTEDVVVITPAWGVEGTDEKYIRVQTSTGRKLSVGSTDIVEINIK